MRNLVSIKTILVVLATICLVNLAHTQTVSADTVTDTVGISASIIPIEIEPVCSDAATGLAHWKVTNKNLQNVNVNWTNLYNNATGDFAAVNGVSEMLTSYDAVDPNNTTSFTSGPDTNQTNATKAACAPVVVTPPTPTCVDGNIQQNLVVTFPSHGTVHIGTLNNLPLCEDVSIYFSSYIMPANYDGGEFWGNTTAYPQNIFSNAHTTLKKGKFIDRTLTIDLPDSCNNVQVDVYYGPKIQYVGAGGHGTQNILSEVYRSTGSCTPAPCHHEPETPPVVVTPTEPTPPIGGGGMGGGLPEDTTPVIVASIVAPKPVQLPATLPNTGSNLLLTIATVPLAVMMFSFLGAEAFQKKRLLARASN